MKNKKTLGVFISSFFLGIISSFLGLMGISGFCCTVLGASILFYLGLASLSTFLVYNAWWLLVVSAVFFLVSIIYYHKHKKICKKKKK